MRASTALEAQYRSTMELRDLPSVDELARAIGDPLAVDAARTVLARAREEIRRARTRRPPGAFVPSSSAARAPRLRRVLNATGVIVHTNLGRAPLAAEALARVYEAARGYSNLRARPRGRGIAGRGRTISPSSLRRLTGAEAALVVNNNAAAVLLALAALARDARSIVSRGELVEIGDGFRIPDVLVRSGARLVEVGTTNRTRAADYERAIGPETALVLRVHRRTSASSASPSSRASRSSPPSPARMACRSSTTSARAHSATCRESRPRASRSRPVPTSSASPATSSSAARRPASSRGRADLVERLRRHPLQRALRVDKLTLAALEGTLQLHLESPMRVPVLRMLGEDVSVVRARAERLAELTGGSVEETVARVGGGALPLAELPSFACALDESLAAPLRTGEPPVVGIVRDGKLLLDCRTLADDELDEVAAAVSAAR